MENHKCTGRYDCECLQTEQQKTAEPGEKEGLERVLLTLMTLGDRFDIESESHARIIYLEAVGIVSDLIKSEHLTAISTDNAKRGDEYVLDRYVGWKKMAEGAVVNANSLEEAMQKAAVLFAADGPCKFKIRDCHTKTGIKYQDAIRELQEIIADCDAHGTRAKMPLPVRVRVLCDVVIEQALTTTAAIYTQRGDYRTALEKIDAIRNSIIGYQNINWSAHIYPLVAALEEAGFPGMGYDEASKLAKTQIDRIEELEAQVAALTSKPEAAGQEREGLASLRKSLYEHLRNLQEDKKHNDFGHFDPHIDKAKDNMDIIDRLMGGEGNDY